MMHCRWCACVPLSTVKLNDHVDPKTADFSLMVLQYIWWQLSLADLGGVPGAAPKGPDSFISTFKICVTTALGVHALPQEILDPPLIVCKYVLCYVYVLCVQRCIFGLSLETPYWMPRPKTDVFLVDEIHWMQSKSMDPSHSNSTDSVDFKIHRFQ